MSPRRLAQLLVLAASLALALLVAEVALRSLRPEVYRVWPPGMRAELHPAPDVLPGVSGPSRFLVNREGLRADEPKAGDAFRVLTLGGSTTECLFLDHDETWPHLLQDRLRAAGKPAFVGNAGKSGQSTRLHRLQAQHLLAQHPDTKAVTVLAGINDLLRVLENQAPRRGPFEPADYLKAFTVVPRQRILPAHAPALASTRLYGLLFTREVPPTAAVSDIVQDPEGKFYVPFRAQRKARPKRTELPPLDEPLAAFRENLEAIADTARARGVRLVLLTQPVLWRADLPPELEGLLWFGWGPESAFYYTPALLAQAMDRYNQVTLEVCRARGVPCVDLAAKLPKDGTVFYDDCHFNEAGARRVAELVAEGLRE